MDAATKTTLSVAARGNRSLRRLLEDFDRRLTALEEREPAKPKAPRTPKAVTDLGKRVAALEEIVGPPAPPTPETEAPKKRTRRKKET